MSHLLLAGMEPALIWPQESTPAELTMASAKRFSLLLSMTYQPFRQLVKTLVPVQRLEAPP